MGIDGSYQIEIRSPMGPVGATLVLKSEGGDVSGHFEGRLGKADFSGGTASDGGAAWTMDIKSPMGPMKLTFTIAVAGDEVTGEVKAGGFGTFPVTGKRA